MNPGHPGPAPSSRETSWLPVLAVPPVLLVLVAAGGISLFESFNDPAMPDRLAPAFALAGGHPLWTMPGAGPALSPGGGPVGALSYLPATLFHGPDGALLAGFLLNLLFHLAPLCVVAAWLARKGCAPPLYAFFAVAAFAFLGVSRRISLGPVAWLQPHAPVLFWSGLALVSRMLSVGGGRNLSNFAAALFGALAFWTDPALAAVVPVLMIAAASTGGRGAAVRWIGLLLACLVALGAALVPVCGGFRALHFNLVTLPLESPWAVRFTIRGFFSTLMEQAEFVRAPMLLAIPFFIAQLRRDSVPPPARPSRLHDHPSLLLLLQAALLMPLTSLVAMKRGGSDAAFALPAWFLAAYVLAALPDVLGPLSSGARRLQYAALAFVLILTYADAPLGPLLPRLDRYWANARQTDLARMCGYIEDRRGQVWFPASPLAHLIVENRPCHSSAGLRRLAEAGHGLNASEAGAWMPARTELILLPPWERPETIAPFIEPAFEAFAHPAFKTWHAFRRPGRP